MKLNPAHRGILFVVVCALLPTALRAQSREGEQIAQARRAFSEAFANFKRSYYDASFQGLNIDSMYDATRAELTRGFTTQQRYRAIERFFEAFDDRHTGFVVPWRLGLWDYHIGLHFYGETPLVIKVDAGSHADSVGVRVGDEIVTFAGKQLTRANQRQVLADFVASDPIRPLELTLRGVDGSISKVAVKADTMELRRMRGSQFRRLLSNYRDSSEFATSHLQFSIADSVFVWRLPQFASIDKNLGDVVARARKHRVLIMDLRGNPGGSIETLTKVLSYFVDEELVVGDLHMRTGNEKYVAKPKKERINSRIFVLVDSRTASAAEILARILQLQGKAIVIGDRTAGAVMVATYFPCEDWMGLYLTISDFVLYNGERLEKTGVKPDIVAVESARHVAAGTDPVLSLGLLRAGVRVAPAAARQLYQHHK